MLQYEPTNSNSSSPNIKSFLEDKILCCWHIQLSEMSHQKPSTWWTIQIIFIIEVLSKKLNHWYTQWSECILKCCYKKFSEVAFDDYTSYLLSICYFLRVLRMVAWTGRPDYNLVWLCSSDLSLFAGHNELLTHILFNKVSLPHFACVCGGRGWSWGPINFL